MTSLAKTLSAKSSRRCALDRWARLAVVWLCVLTGCLVCGVCVAQAVVTHEFLPSVSEAISKGVPASVTSEEALLPGPLGGVNALTVDSGHVWVAERIDAGEHVGRSRVDEFDASSGVFVPPQLGEEDGVAELDEGVGVGHPAAGEEEVYVGAGQAGKYVVAVFGSSGKLQPGGVWDGKNTPNRSFNIIRGLAVDGSANPETHGDVYIATNGFTGGEGAVDVFAGEAGGKEPSKVIAQLTGTPSGPFVEPQGVAVSGFNGDVLVTDGNAEACRRGEGECVVDVFEPVSGMPGVYNFLFKIGGSPEGSFQDIAPVAVDGGNGDIYVVEKATNVVYQFNFEGKYLGRLTGVPSGPSGQVRPFKGLTSVAVDGASGDVYVGDFNAAQQTGAVDVFGKTLVVPDVTTGVVTGVGVTGAGGIEAVLNGTVNPDKEGEASCRFAWGTTKAFGQLASCEPEKVGEGSSPVGVHGTLSASSGVLAPDTTYYYRLQASNKNGTNPGGESEDKEFTTPGPGLHGESVSGVSSASATFGATINPHGKPTSYYFQYGKSSEYEAQSPMAPGVSLGNGEGDVQVAPRHVQGLAPGTVYHYRVVAVSELEVEGTLEGVSFAGPDLTFMTQGAGGALALPDGRQWELVSPPNKHGALLGSIGDSVIQASVSGGAVSYVETLPTEEGVPGYVVGEVQVVSTRGEDGWSSRDISLPHASATGLLGGREYLFFSSDLSYALVEPVGGFTSLEPEVFPPDSEHTPYVRHNSTCAAAPSSCFEPLVTGAPGYADVPEGTKFGDAKFVGGSSDLAHVILGSKVALTATPTGGREALYEWSAGSPSSEELRLVSVLPANEKSEEKPSSAPADLGFANKIVRNAVSVDGSRVVWSEENGHLYLRDTVRGKTVQLDVAEPSCLSGEECGAGQASPRFQLASRDGSRVLFTDVKRLTKDSGRVLGKPDLYQCEMVEQAGKPQCELSNLTPSPGPEEGADVQGAVIGASEDGSWVYFVANGILGDGGEHGAVQGNCTVNADKGEGACNLYVYHDGATHLVAVMAGEDYPDWNGKGGSDLNKLTARVSPDGRWLAFMSSRSLTGYDNHDALSGKPDEEVFLYHAEGSEGLVCTSCNPSGARPMGVEYAKLEERGLVSGDRVWTSETWIAANVPGWTPYGLGKALYQSRYLSDEGRLFFNSSDALVAQDINKNEDVYEYEPVGVGDCSSVSATFSTAGGGCVALVSSGQSSEESAFLDASENGSDVFFLSGERLVARDVDTALDVYDAHVCSTGAPCFSEPVGSPACTTAESCRAAPSLQPSIFGSPASATFSGQGNVTLSGPVVRARGKVLTRAQRLTAALRACRRVGSKGRRVRCERVARKRYGARIGSRAHKGGK